MVSHSGPLPGPAPLQLLSWESCSHRLCSALDPDSCPPNSLWSRTRWLLSDGSHVNPAMGLSSLSPQPVATAPPYLGPAPTGLLFYTPLCLLQHSSYTAGSPSPVTQQGAGPLLRDPTFTNSCSAEVCTHCLLSSLALSFWRTLPCLTPSMLLCHPSCMSLDPDDPPVGREVDTPLWNRGCVQSLLYTECPAHTPRHVASAVCSLGVCRICPAHTLICTPVCYPIQEGQMPLSSPRAPPPEHQHHHFPSHF